MSIAANCAVDTGLFSSDVLSTLPRPTWEAVVSWGLLLFPVWEDSSSDIKFKDVCNPSTFSIVWLWESSATDVTIEITPFSKLVKVTLEVPETSPDKITSMLGPGLFVALSQSK